MKRSFLRRCARRALGTPCSIAGSRQGCASGRYTVHAYACGQGRPGQRDAATASHRRDTTARVGVEGWERAQSGGRISKRPKKPRGRNQTPIRLAPPRHGGGRGMMAWGGARSHSQAATPRPATPWPPSLAGDSINCLPNKA